MGRKDALWRYNAEDRIETWTTTVGGRFEEAYRYLRATTQFDPPVSFLGAWLSLNKDDRGELPSWDSLANFLAVSLRCLYTYRTEFQLDEWAAQLRLMELHGYQLGEVDRITYIAAVDPESPVDARRLYYQRAGVLGQDITVHTRSQKEKLHDWLSELRGVGQDETLALESDVVELLPLEIDQNDVQEEEIDD